jgi:predicted DNA-binding protein
MKNPRVFVTLNKIDLERIEALAKERNLSVSSLVRKIVEKYLEELRDEK